MWLCVCVWGGSVSHGGALSVITISDWVRAKVCDISQLSTHSVALETHLGVTLSSSPSSLRLSSPSLPPLLRRFPGRFGAVVFHMQGAIRLDGYCSSVTSTPPPHTHTTTSSSLSPFQLSSSDPLLPFHPQVLSFWSPPHVPFSSPPLPPPFRSSVAASDCTGLFGMQEAPEAWRV